MVTDVLPVVGSPAAVPDEVLDPVTGCLNNVDDVDTIDDEFVALIYSDEELLRDEFDALMAAAWTSPPPAETRDPAAEHPPDSTRSYLPAMRGRLALAMGAGRRTLVARTRAPPHITDGSPSSLRRTRGGLDFADRTRMIRA